MNATKAKKYPTFRYEGWVDIFKTVDGERVFSHQQRVGTNFVHDGNLESARAAIEALHVKHGVGITLLREFPVLNKPSKSCPLY